MNAHVSEDNCLECPEIDLENKFGNLFYCRVIKNHVRTNPYCEKGWLIIEGKIRRVALIEKVSQGLRELIKEEEENWGQKII